MTKGNKFYNKRGLIFYNGGYPSGSWPNRVRHIRKGLRYYGIDIKIIISWPPPTIEDKNNSEHFIKYIFRPCKKRLNRKGLLFLFFYLLGTFRGFLYLRKNRKIDFVLFAQGSFIECFLIMTYCKRKKIKFLVDLVDENSKKYWESNLTIFDRIAKLNKELYNIFIIPKVDTLFVISNYLEKKYKNYYPHLKVIKSTPALIDFDSYNKNKYNNISNIIEPNLIKILNEKGIKIVYAGSCARINGIKFFLECISDLIHRYKYDVWIIFFVLLGDKKKLITISNNLGIQDNVFVFDSVLPKYLPAIYERVDILFLPEHGEVIANAGFPGKTAEYLASGKAIITTIFSDLSDYLTTDYNAMMSPIGDKTSYCVNLIKLIEDKNLRMKLGTNGIKTAKENFEVKEAIKRYLNDL